MAADNHEDTTTMELSVCAGDSLAEGQIVFSVCSRYFACCWGRSVKVYNTINGQCSQVLTGHRNTVTGLAINPANKLQLFSCGLDGDIKQWIYLDGVLLRTYSFYMPLHALITVDPSATAVTVIAHRPQAAGCSLLRLPLRKERSTSETPESVTEGSVKSVILPECDADPRRVAFGCGGQYIAAVQGQKLSVYSCQKKSHIKHMTKAKNPFTCVACHPTDDCLATGHDNGEIKVWRSVFHKERTVVSPYHWHSLPVLCLAFSPQGSVLLSGGHECTVVRKQLGSEVRPDTLPRLGAPIHTLTPSPDGALYVASHTDNVLQLITSSSLISQAVCGLARAHLGAPAVGRPMPVGLLYDPRSKAIVTNGRPGHLQFYCIDTDRQLFNLDITGQNYVSPDSLDQPTVVTEVEQATFDPTGSWLATFQRWDDGVMTPDFCLKFWHYDRKQQNYQLNTTVEMPHYKTVQCLRFRPGPPAQSSPLMVSTGDDGLFKLWTLFSEKRQAGTARWWGCVWQGGYRQKAAGEARFSPDGRQLAVVFVDTVTLWDPDSNTLLHRIPLFCQPVRCMEFGGGESSHYLVVTTSSHLTVFDLRTMSVPVQMKIPEAVLAVDGHQVCAASQQQVYVFSLNEERPSLQQYSCSHPVVHASFLPHGGSSRLFLIDCRQTLLTLTPSKADTQPSRAQVELSQNLPQTPFQALLMSTHTHPPPPSMNQQSGLHLLPTALAGVDVMNEPCHTAPPVSSKAVEWLDSMMVRRKGVVEMMDVAEDREEEEAFAMVMGVSG